MNAKYVINIFMAKFVVVMILASYLVQYLSDVITSVNGNDYAFALDPCKFCEIVPWYLFTKNLKMQVVWMSLTDTNNRNSCMTKHILPSNFNMCDTCWD